MLKLLQTCGQIAGLKAHRDLPCVNIVVCEYSFLQEIYHLVLDGVAEFDGVSHGPELLLSPLSQLVTVSTSSCPEDSSPTLRNPNQQHTQDVHLLKTIGAIPARNISERRSCSSPIFPSPTLKPML